MNTTTTEQPLLTCGNVTLEAYVNVLTAGPWCVYEHYLYDDQAPDNRSLIFIGSCPLRDVFTFADARKNTEWCRIVTPESYLFIRVIAIGGKTLCVRSAAAEVHKRTPRPRCNAVGFNTHGLSRQVLCSNGQTYPSQQDASRSLNISQSVISRHMNGDLRHAGGLTFTWKDV